MERQPNSTQAENKRIGNKAEETKNQPAEEQGGKDQRARQYVVIALFILTLLAPSLLMEFRLLPVVNYEQRTMALKPAGIQAGDFNWLDVNDYGRVLGECDRYFRDYEAYINDNLAFKNELVVLDSVYKGLFRSSSSKVVQGKEDWLFYTCPEQPEADPIGTFMGLNRFSEAQLVFLRGKFEAFDAKLRGQGITFFLMIPPNKHSVYSEMLPDLVLEHAGETRMDQLLRYLKETTDIRIIDVKTPLIREHSLRQLYYKTDTHWNRQGAYIAYAEMLRAFGMEPYGTDDFDIFSETVKAMDLARMKGGVGLTDMEYTFVPRKGPEAELIEGSFDTDKVAVYSNHDEAAPSLMIFHDSYNVALMPFLTPHFNRTISSWSLYTGAGMILERDPDYVVFEILERNLVYLFHDECLVE